MKVRWRALNLGALLHSMCIGFILDKTIGINCPKRLENATILIANTCQCSGPGTVCV